MAIGGGGKMAQLAGAIGERGNHCVAVGDGFVAGRLDATGQGLGRVYCAFLHARILAWGLLAKNFTTEGAETGDWNEKKPVRLYSFEDATAREMAKLPGTRFRII
jgi:hypothetical protein